MAIQDLFGHPSINNFLNRSIVKDFECQQCYNIMFSVCIKTIIKCPLCANISLYYHESNYLNRMLKKSNDEMIIQWLQ